MIKPKVKPIINERKILILAYSIAFSESSAPVGLNVLAADIAEPMSTIILLIYNNVAITHSITQINSNITITFFGKYTYFFYKKQIEEYPR